MRTLNQITQQRYSALFCETGAFFSFSAEQFARQRKAGVQYVDVGAGLLCPKEQASYLLSEFPKIAEAGIQEDIAENGKPAIISRELFNYECFYTGDISDCVSALAGYGITEEEVWEAYQKIAPTVEC